MKGAVRLPPTRIYDLGDVERILVMFLADHNEPDPTRAACPSEQRVQGV